jgi:glycosyltransferase involved in cell wall biosynthesis
MALGVPVVTTDTGGVREQVEEGVTGFVVPPGDPGALADALARVAADPAWRARAQGRAREIVGERFSVEAATAGLAAVLHEVAR